MIDIVKNRRRCNLYEGAFIETAVTPDEVSEAVALEEATVDGRECGFLSSEANSNESSSVSQHQKVKP